VLADEQGHLMRLARLLSSTAAAPDNPDKPTPAIKTSDCVITHPLDFPLGWLLENRYGSLNAWL
jgi:hypothetical protein